MRENKSLTTTKLPALVKKIKQHHDECLNAFGTSVRHAYECGRLLAEAKKALPHGEHERWVHRNFDFGDRTAQLYKRVFENWDAIKARTADMASLSLSQASRALTNPKQKPLPQEVQDDPALKDDEQETEQGTTDPPATSSSSSSRSSTCVPPAPTVLQGLMEKYELHGQPKKLLEFLRALGFEQAEIEAKLKQL